MFMSRSRLRVWVWQGVRGSVGNLPAPPEGSKESGMKSTAAVNQPDYGRVWYQWCFEGAPSIAGTDLDPLLCLARSPPD